MTDGSTAGEDDARRREDDETVGEEADVVDDDDVAVGDGGAAADDEVDDGAGESPAELLGRTRWAIPGGHVPVDSTGPEPEMVSHDAICLLNTSRETATVELTLRYADGREAGPYPLTVAAERVRHVRINDLIDPYAPPLGRAYGIVAESTVPVVVQFTRQDTRQDANATLSTVAYGEE